jgi:hypothetical protein
MRLAHRLALGCVVGLAPAIAAAEPGPSAECDVQVLHAPDDVRAEIDVWMRSEPHCQIALRVRVVPTDGGLYVIAQEPSGKLHERVVVDGATVAALVASWAADDGTRHSPAPAPAATPAPSAAARVDAPGTVVPRAPEPQRLVDIGGMYSLVEDGTSLRIGVDIQPLGPAMLGVVAARQTTTWSMDLRTTDLQLLARVAIERPWGALWGRAEVGAGVVRVSDTMGSSAAGVMAQGSLTAGVWLTDNWRLRGGPLVETVPDAKLQAGVVRSGLDIRLWIGVDRRL